ncbi:hypothetical protein TNCV_4171331 [Trichonephila clavipes]|nr:hypothetical protein TNCV_4171331 [Trichonephila clavipes]
MLLLERMTGVTIIIITQDDNVQDQERVVLLPEGKRVSWNPFPLPSEIEKDMREDRLTVPPGGENTTCSGSRHRAARRKLASKYRDWMQSEWSQVLFTDESRFNLDFGIRQPKIALAKDVYWGSRRNKTVDELACFAKILPFITAEAFCSAKQKLELVNNKTFRCAYIIHRIAGKNLQRNAKKDISYSLWESRKNFCVLPHF